jgi:predicted branched-subunit amino acid permease
VNTAQNEISNNGIIFIYISLSVFSATIISYFTPQRFDLFYIYLLIWFGCFSIFFLIFKSKIIKSLYNIRTRIRKSTDWPTSIKIINGICWVAPFVLGALIPSMHEYLILAGIGFGNISTFIIFLLMNKIKNIDQLIVGLISMISIGIIIFLYDGKVIEKSYGEFLARILISIAYGIGGIYSAIIKPE